MKILVTGGNGYIGSHTCVELLNNGYEVVILDNFSNSKRENLSKIKQITGKDFTFYEGNMIDEDILDKIFISFFNSLYLSSFGFNKLPNTSLNCLTYPENPS